MLSAKALSELLSKNSDGRLCKRWFLMTRNGTLLAYTEPTNIQELRKQAAMATLSWQEYQDPAKNTPVDADVESGKPVISGSLHTLTVESESSNLIIRKIQSQLLLVLEGGVPPRNHTFETRVTPEGAEDAPYPSQDGDVEPVLGSSASSAANSIRSTAASGVLALQRRKLDALASAIAVDFDRTGFKMPEDGNSKLF